MSDITFQRQGGGNPVTFIGKVADAAQITLGDMLAVGLDWRTEIVTKTLAGTDVDGNQFAPYSTKPFYYTPESQAGSRATLKQKQGTVKRLFKKVSKGNPVSGPRPSRTGRSIFFPGGYAQFKQWLGRSSVDLTGPRAPHMLQSIVVRAGISATRQPDDNTVPSPTDATERADVMTMGIYGEKAARALGHNDGNIGSHLPQRRFFDASDAMLNRAGQIISKRIDVRLEVASK